LTARHSTAKTTAAIPDAGSGLTADNLPGSTADGRDGARKQHAHAPPLHASEQCFWEFAPRLFPATRQDVVSFGAQQQHVEWSSCKAGGTLCADRNAQRQVAASAARPTIAIATKAVNSVLYVALRIINILTCLLS